jgi:hypothetical protein
VLGLPPAFVLSQDQTLKLNENLSPAGHLFRRLIADLYFDESQAHLYCGQEFHSLDELASRDRQSISQPLTAQRWHCQRPARTPPSTFLFLPIQLSNSDGYRRLSKRNSQNDAKQRNSQNDGSQRRRQLTPRDPIGQTEPGIKGDKTLRPPVTAALQSEHRL